VCKVSVKAPKKKTFGADTAQDVAAKMNSLRTKKFEGVCRTGRGPSMILVFRYNQGPPAAVTVWGKECGAENHFLQSAISSALLADMSNLLT
jgi:hypothetical protein